MCVELLLLKKRSCVCVVKRIAREDGRKILFFVTTFCFCFFFVFFSRGRELCFFCLAFIQRRALVCVDIARASLFHITNDKRTSSLCDFKRNSRSLLRYTHTERERVSE